MLDFSGACVLVVRELCETVAPGQISAGAVLNGLPRDLHSATIVENP